MSDSPLPNPPGVENTVDLLKAVLAISRQDGIEAIAYEACKQIAMMLDVFTVSFVVIDQEEMTGHLITEYLGDDRVTDQRWYQPISYKDLHIMAGVIERRQTFQFHKDDPFIANATEMAIFAEFFAKQIVIVPVLTRDDVFGMLLLWDRSSTRVFRANDIAFLELLANNIGIMVERTQLADRSESRANELESLHDVSLALSANMNLDRILEHTIDGVFQMDENVLCASLKLNTNGKLEKGFSRCFGKSENIDCPENNKIATQVICTGKRVVIDDPEAVESIDHCSFNSEILALIGLPLQTGGKLLGVLQISYRDPREFSARSVQILEMLADRAAMAIQNVQLLERITNQAMTDPLTGIANRRAFEQKLKEEIARAKRNHAEFCLLFIDLDGFKQVNDRFGHPAGDKTLQKVTQCFQNFIRESDVVARLGGDEFVFLLPDTNFEGGNKVASKIQEAFKICEFDWKTEPDAVALGVSIGVVQYPDQADSIEVLYRLGDELLYRSKGQRKDK